MITSLFCSCLVTLDNLIFTIIMTAMFNRINTINIRFELHRTTDNGFINKINNNLLNNQFI